MYADSNKKRAKLCYNHGNATIKSNEKSDAVQVCTEKLAM